MENLQGEPTTNRKMADAFVHDIYTEDYKDKKGGVTQLSAEINETISNMMQKGNYPEIQVVEGVKPKTYRWNTDISNRNDNFERVSTSDRKQHHKKKGKDEQGLYQPLREYLKTRGIYAKRIDEKKSINRGGKGRNKWRHPDVVGVEGLISGKKLHHSIKAIAKYTIDRAKLYAYEVKEEVTGRSLREDFHQTVSSSIWANFGFLCAEKFDVNDETRQELRQLNQAYGIGFILIDRKNPKESEIVFPAREKKVDLEICSTLAYENTDFEDFISRALDVYETGNVRF